MSSVDAAETMPLRATCDRRRSGSGAVFFAEAERLSSPRAAAARNVKNGSRVMTLAGRLSMVIAYVAFAFVGAIVIGLF